MHVTPEMLEELESEYPSVSQVANGGREYLVLQRPPQSPVVLTEDDIIAMAPLPDKE